MNKMSKKSLIGAGILAMALVASGCSTVLRGTHEKVKIVSTPESAHCSIYRDSTGYLKSVATPGAVYIPRSNEAIRVVCKKDGYKTASIVASPIDGDLGAGNAVGAASSSFAGAAGIIGGFAVDAFNSATTDYPDTISVEMEEE